MGPLENIDLFAVGISTAAIGLLGFIVFFKNRKSITNQTFLVFSITTILYSFFNYFVYNTTDPDLVLWTLRISVFFVVWHAFGIFQLFYVFPKEQIEFSFFYKFLLVPFVGTVAILTLTPFVFSEII
ncbi:MAG: Integral membrane sensor signal transduction histidine kinase, partial [Parcubacteria group bacterium Gr01-1014_66]